MSLWMKKKWGKEKINDTFKLLKLLFILLARAKIVLYYIVGEEMLCFVLTVPFPHFIGSKESFTIVLIIIPVSHTLQHVSRKNGVVVHITSFHRYEYVEIYYSKVTKRDDHLKLFIGKFCTFHLIFWEKYT